MDPDSPFYGYLSAEEQILIRSGCAMLFDETKAESYRFWGKIYGTSGDYYVLQSVIYHPFQHPKAQYRLVIRICT